MSDPVLDEAHILDILSGDNHQNEGEYNTTQRLQTAALMSLVDAYDRKATRDNFILTAAAALGLHSATGKKLMLVSINEARARDELTEAAFLVADAEINKIVSARLDELIKMVTMLAQCPTSKDTVN